MAQMRQTNSASVGPVLLPYQTFVRPPAMSQFDPKPTIATRGLMFPTGRAKSRCTVWVRRQRELKDGTLGYIHGRPQSSPVSIDGRAANR
jgi:hypothetical protein